MASYKTNSSSSSSISAARSACVEQNRFAANNEIMKKKLLSQNYNFSIISIWIAAWRLVAAVRSQWPGMPGTVTRTLQTPGNPRQPSATLSHTGSATDLVSIGDHADY